MTSINIAALINLLGFTTGIVLYAMLLVMVLRHPAYAQPTGSTRTRLIFGWSANGLLLTTAILGLLWNIGALATFGLRDLRLAEPYPVLIALAYTALGFLPAVVVHSALKNSDAKSMRLDARLIVIAAYGLSVVAGLLHFYNAFLTEEGPSLPALRLLTFGYLALIVALFLSTRRQPGWKRAVWASALAVFAVSALHLSQHAEGNTDAWFTELTGHHASLPLALAILYQDYRFAFADIFLKRALALLLLVGLALGLYVTAAAPLLAIRDPRGQTDPRAVGVLLGLWIITALAYPLIRRATVWFVDNVILRRANYAELRARVSRLLEEHESSAEALDDVRSALAPALSAHDVSWSRTGPTEPASNEEIASRLPEQDDGFNSIVPAATDSSTQPGARIAVSTRHEYVTLLERASGKSALVFIPTTEPPFYQLTIGALSGGRRLLSDDIAMLEAVALMTARRIDALRVTHERCEQVQREQEISKLATEAQLRALRAQLNPHFLFNALTTIGYLVQAAPERAVDTLMRLTSLLRGVLRNTDEFVTLGDELKLITAYLEIEQARFEERLRVRVDVLPELLTVRLPSLLIQPLVENAVKHGIAPSRYGGEVIITASLESSYPSEQQDEDTLCITVTDTGAGASEIEMARGRRRGLGLSNVEQRLRCYCGQAASLRIASTPGAGAIVEVRLPFNISTQAQHVALLATASDKRERRGA